MPIQIAILLCTVLVSSAISLRSEGTSFKRLQIYRALRECQCPLRCIVSFRQCLISGTCRTCSLPNYGKRQENKDLEERYWDDEKSSEAEGAIKM